MTYRRNMLSPADEGIVADELHGQRYQTPDERLAAKQSGVPVDDADYDMHVYERRREATRVVIAGTYQI